MSDKSVVYVTNNKRLYLTFCTIEADYWQWQTRNRAASLRQQSYLLDITTLTCIWMSRFQL